MLVLGAGGPELQARSLSVTDLEEETNAEGGGETWWAVRRAAVGRLEAGEQQA